MSDIVTQSNRHYLRQLKTSGIRTIDLSSAKNSYTNYIMERMAYATPESIDMMFKITIESMLLSAVDSNGELNDAFGGLLEFELHEYNADIDEYLHVPIGDMYSDGLELYNTIYDLILNKSRKYRPIVYKWLDGNHVMIRDGGGNMGDGKVIMLDIPDILSMFIVKYNIDTSTETFMMYIDNVIHGAKQLSNNSMLNPEEFIQEAIMDFRELLTTKESVSDFVTVYNKTLSVF